MWYQRKRPTSAASDGASLVGIAAMLARLRCPPMRLLHVGWGFSPWRSGGLIRYAEDVMALQAARGHEVHYLCSGRHYPRLAGPRLKRWTRAGVRVHEVVNPPILVGVERGTREPERDLDEPRLERLFRRLLVDEVRPDVVHVQELLGMPSSILDIAREAGVPVVMTLQDYFPLCPTLRLLDADGNRCLDPAVRPACAMACAGAPADAGPLVGRTLRFELTRAREAVPWLRRVSFGALRPAPRSAGRPRRRGGAGGRALTRHRRPGPAPPGRQRRAAQPRRPAAGAVAPRRGDLPPRSASTATSGRCTSRSPTWSA